MTANNGGYFAPQINSKKERKVMKNFLLVISMLVMVGVASAGTICTDTTSTDNMFMTLDFSTDRTNDIETFVGAGLYELNTSDETNSTGKWLRLTHAIGKDAFQFAGGLTFNPVNYVFVYAGPTFVTGKEFDHNVTGSLAVGALYANTSMPVAVGVGYDQLMGATFSLGSIVR